MIQKRKRKELYDKFRQGAIPSGADFGDFIRSQLNLLDDGIDISDDPDEPINFRAHGEEDNFLDLSDGSGRKRWRITGRSEDGINEGLNLKAENNSKLYVDRETGNIGISTDQPEAKIHIKQTSAADALRVDDEGIDETPFIITSDGKVGIGIGMGNERPSARLHVNHPGIGNALRVDDTSQDTTPFIINQEGNVGLGYDQPQSKLTVQGGVSIGKNENPGKNSLYVEGNIECGGNLSLTGGTGVGGIEIKGPLQSDSHELIIKDNLKIVADPSQSNSDGNLSVQGDTTLGTFNSIPNQQNVVSINGKLKSGRNPDSGEEQYELEINNILTVNRDTNTAQVKIKAPLSVLGTSTLGNNMGNDIIYLNGTVKRKGNSAVTIDDDLTVTKNANISSAVIKSLKLNQGTVVTEISTDKTLVGNSDSAIPTEKAVKEYIDNLLVGTVAAFAMSTPPSGWLVCNGQSVSRTGYHRLYALIGVNFGPGDGLHTFNIPDLRNEFIRGSSHNRHPGKKEDSAFENHRHNFYGSYSTIYGGGHSHYDGTGNIIWQITRRAHAFFHDKWLYQYNPSGRTGWSSHNHGYVPYGTISGATTGRSTSETRPRNIALMFCIKY